MMHNLRWLTLKILIAIFWGSLIALFLYAPLLVDALQGDNHKSLNLFTWPQLIDVEYLEKFEQETGIKVHVSYYEENEEMLVKLQATGGQGYDLIVPSDFAVQFLIKEGLLKKIDKHRLTFFNQINPDLLHRYFDPENDYSVPYLYGVYGIGINKEFFNNQTPRASWELIFKRIFKNKNIGMVNDARFNILIAAKYLFGTIDNLTPEQLERIKNLLVEQKQWVEMYNELRADYMMTSRLCPIVMGLNTEIWKAMLTSPAFEFLIPEEGAFMIIDNFVIPSASKREEDVYKLINFLYREDVLKNNLTKFAFFSTLKTMDAEQDPRRPIPTPEQMNKMDFFRYVIPQEVVNDTWIAVKA